MKAWLPTLVLVTVLGAVRPAGAQQATDVASQAPSPAFTLDARTIQRALWSNVADARSTGRAEFRVDQAGTASNWAAEGRACEGCPRRRVWAAYFQSAVVNVFYNLGNKARGEETAKVSWHSWGTNLKYGFEWDDNPFTTNQFGHPYQGSNYYTAGRANGLSYWESAAVAAFGSATWEYFGENNYASLNDLINTTLGGIALGEMFHRTAWLIRDTHATGKPRLWQEIFATAVDPVGGANRFISGDASRVSDKPATFVPSAKQAVGQFGVLWQGDSTGAIEPEAEIFLEMDLKYGDMWRGRSREPFEAFDVNLRLGGGKALSDVRVRGELLGQPLGPSGGVQMTLMQSYDYVANKAYEFGRQGFDLGFSALKQMTSSVSAVFVVGAGVTPLGAVNRLSPSLVTQEDPEEAGRNYDYGPGTAFGGGASFLHHGIQFAQATYQGYQLYVVDGIRANHVLQRFRLDVSVPVYRRLGGGVSGEFFYRKTYFHDGGEQRDKFPQLRVFLTWR